MALVLVSWLLNWILPGLRTHILFFPLWLGYCLTIDALVMKRKGTSLLTRNPRAYVMLFFISAPAWWLFELVNLRTQNWFYAGRDHFTGFQYFLFSSLSFSTVIPAVFGSAELSSTYSWIKRIGHGPTIRPERGTLIRLSASGCAMMALLLLWPRYFFPFVWLSVYFILEPLNVWLKNRSLLEYTAMGDWRPILSLWTGCLMCGFFWEMWNYFSYPKWTYQVPYVDFVHVFEMPLLGYAGYLPFSLELFALYHLVVGIARQDGDSCYLQIAYN